MKIVDTLQNISQTCCCESLESIKGKSHIVLSNRNMTFCDFWMSPLMSVCTTIAMIARIVLAAVVVVVVIIHFAC